MLTPRGWWLLVLAATVTALGAVLSVQGHSTILLIGLTLEFWLAWEWLRFARQAMLAVRALRPVRTIRDDRGSVTTLWAGQPFTVTLRVDLDSSIKIRYARLSDRVPVGIETGDEAAGREGPVTRNLPAEWSYRIHCPLPGTARFEGVRVELADAQGLFYFETFLRQAREYPVLPKLVDAEAKQRGTKRFNRLPPPGVHRLRRPGTASELLDLRDYQPGDPPKRIAWKISARRDKLITREFESEVPVRCTLLVDSSSAVRLGPPGDNALAALSAIAATVAQAAIGNRDLVGLAVCDEQTADYVAPARTQAHLISLLHRLARAAALGPAAETDELGSLLDVAYAFALEVYPDLLRPGLNHFPAWLPWLSPPPIWKRKHGRRAPIFAPFARYLRAVQPMFRRRLAWRKKLAALLAVKYRLPPGAVALMQEDDVLCARWTQRFLIDHKVPFDVPLYDARGRFLLARPEKVEVMARALTRAVSRGHDNELFVILADLLEMDDQLKPLLRAVQVARTRHHQVLVVNAWPAGLAGPDESPQVFGENTVTGLVAKATLGRAQRAWREVRKAFGRLGVPVISAATGDPARLILHKLERLRTLQGAGRT